MPFPVFTKYSDSSVFYLTRFLSLKKICGIQLNEKTIMFLGTLGVIAIIIDPVFFHTYLLILIFLINNKHPLEQRRS